MTKKKTSINIDVDLWKQFSLFAVERTGSLRNISSTLEEAIKFYMANVREFDEEKDTK